MLRRIYGETRGSRRLVGAALAVDLLAVPLALLVPIPLKLAVDSVIGDHPLPGVLSSVLPDSVESSPGALIIFLALMMVLIEALRQGQDLASLYLHTVAGERLVLGFRGRLFRHAQRLSIGFHDARGPWDSIYRIQYDAMALQHVVVDALLPLVVAGATVVGMIFITATIDVSLALVALAVTPILVGLSHAYRRPLRNRYRDVKDLETSSLAVISEVLSALRVVKAFGKESHESERFAASSRAGMRARINVAVFQGGFDFLVALTTATGMGVVLVLGVNHVRDGSITLGQLLVVMSYLTQLYIPLRDISNKAADIQASLASAERSFALLDEAPDVPEHPGARRISHARGDIDLRRVSFAYEPGRPILREVSLHVPAGTRVGIAGRTGAGKTTLISLLTRFYDPTDGSIRLDGNDLRELRLADLRDQYAIVLQEPVLFSTSLRENIAYARPGASAEDVEAAARAANAHDFITALPEGYETMVGERGMRLSGGERQRVALARAFLKDAPILILDEPTSSVDVETEQAIIEAMDRLMRGRTSFMIAHRLSTLESCDVVLRIEEGRVLADPPPASREPA